MSEHPANKCIKCNETLEQFKTSDTLLNIIYSLSDRQYKVLLHRVIEKKNLSDVGSIYGVTRERIRNLEHSAFENIIKWGISHRIKITAPEIIDFLWEKRESLAWIVKKEVLAVDSSLDRRRPSALTTFTDNVADTPEGLRALNVRDLGLSARAANCLINFGINTVEELLERRRLIITIKNLGRKSLDEIQQTMNQLGFRVRFDTEYPISENSGE